MDKLEFFEEDQLIASAKNEAVVEQLKAITGLDKELFREVVWVQQEHLKELLDMTPRQRQKRMDQLFGLSDYEVAWSELAGFRKEYEGEKTAYERDVDVVGIEKLQNDYNKAVEEFSLIQDKLEDLRIELMQAEESLRNATTHLQSLEKLRRETEELRRREAELQSNVTNIEEACARLAEESEEKQARINKLGESLKQIDEQEKTYRNKLQDAELKPDQEVEELRRYLSTLEDQMASIRAEQEATKMQMNSTQNRISSLKMEDKCPLCLQVLAGDYRENLLGRLHEENVERERRLVELQKNIDELEGLHSVVDFVASNLQVLIPRIEEIKIRISEEQESLDKLSKGFEEAQEREKTLRSQLDTTRAEITKFDVSELESARRLRDTAFDRYSSTKSRLETLESRKIDAASRTDSIKERLDHAEKKVERLETIERLLEVIDDIRGAYRSIQPRLRSEPSMKSEEGYERDVSNLSGGERTLLAFAYRLGLGQLIMQSRTGHGLYLLLLDEPTESLGREDGSVDRLAEAISRSKAIQQVIAVTHSEAFAEKAEHVIRVEKEAGVSRVFVER